MTTSLGVESLGRIFEAAPNPYLLLHCDAPRFTIAAVSNAYLAATGTERAAIVGRGLFEVFPDNPSEDGTTSVSDLRSSLERVLRERAPDSMGVQKYDIPLRDGSDRFEVKYWSPINTPVLGPGGVPDYIIHRVEDVTEFVLMREHSDAEFAKRTQSLAAKAERMEAEVLRGGAEIKAANRDLKHSLARLAEVNEKLQDVDRLKTEFFANVSHEFRTPLTLLLGPIEELLRRSDELLPGDGRRLVEMTQRNAVRLLKLVNVLLDFSRLEAGRANPRFAATDLAAFTAELASHFDSACSEAGLSLTLDCDPLPPVEVDRDMWEKIVLNLLSNAFKFTMKGGIDVSLKAVDGAVRLVVSDTGVGVPEDELPRIFERFHRIEGQASRSREGTGIGLALVRELVGVHGGAIAAERRDEGGTRFLVSIPIAPRGAAAAAAADETDGPGRATVDAHHYGEAAQRWVTDAKAADAAPAAPDPALAQGARRVLLVDDNADMRAYVRRILEEVGYAVEAVSSPDTALARLAAPDLPDLVLSDVMMPGSIGGFGLLRAVRADPRTATLPVVLLSARADESARIEGLEAGADEYAVKPFGQRELQARLDSAIRLSRLRREAAERERVLSTELATEKSRAALHAAEQRLEVALKAARLGTWELDLHNNIFNTSDVCRSDYGWTSPQPFTYDAMLALVHPDDRARRDAVIAEAFAGRQDLQVDYRIIRPDGEIAWIHVRGRAEYDADGVPLRAMGVSADVTERKRAEARQATLIAELNHRVKNTLASVQSIALQTGMRVQDPTEFVTALDGRIQALVRAHDLLTANAWQGAQLEDVLGRTLAPYGGRPGVARRVVLEGPPVRLKPEAAVTLHMVFHELATNAVKYGALSALEGEVAVIWTVDHATDPAEVEIVWTERRGPPVQPPTRRGFGSNLLEVGLARELGGKVALAFEPEGLVCTMRFAASAKLELA